MFPNAGNSVHSFIVYGLKKVWHGRSRRNFGITIELQHNMAIPVGLEYNSCYTIPKR